MRGIQTCSSSTFMWSISDVLKEPRSRWTLFPTVFTWCLFYRRIFFTCCVLHNYRCVRTCNKTIVPCVRHRGLKFMFISGNHGLEIVFVLFVCCFSFPFLFFVFSHAFPCFNVLAIFPRFASRNFPANCQRDFYLKPFSFWLSLA